MAKIPASRFRDEVLANRASLITGEDALASVVRRELRSLFLAWRREISRVLGKSNPTASEVAEVLRRSRVLRELGLITQTQLAAAESRVLAAARATFRQEVFRTAFLVGGKSVTRSGALAASLRGLSDRAVVAAIEGTMPGIGLVRSFSNLPARAVELMKRDVAAAVADGWDLNALVRKWSRGSGAGRVRRDAETLGRTAMMAASDAGNLKALDQSGLFDDVRWNATFDLRTCPRCASLHGRVFPIKKAPPCPAHLMCRCILVPVFGDPAIDRELARLRKYPRPAPSADLSRSRDFEAWLRKRSPGELRDFFGSDLKYQAWKSGRVSLGRLSHPDGQTITDAELSRLLKRP